MTETFNDEWVGGESNCVTPANLDKRILGTFNKFWMCK
jgi:hypothetical protein